MDKLSGVLSMSNFYEPSPERTKPNMDTTNLGVNTLTFNNGVSVVFHAHPKTGLIEWTSTIEPSNGWTLSTANQFVNTLYVLSGGN